MSHIHPMTVTVAVPTPEALHELSIFLQEYTRRHHGAAPHHQTFVQETGGHPAAAHAAAQSHHASAPHHPHASHPHVLQPLAHGGPAGYAGTPQQTPGGNSLLGYGGMNFGPGGAAPQPQAPAITFQDIVNLQKNLIETGAVTTQDMLGIYQRLNIDPAAGVQPHHYGTLHGELSKFVKH